MKSKKRRTGRLSKTSGFKQPSQLIFFDTETYNNYIRNGVHEQVLRLGVAQYIYLNSKQEIKRQEECIFYDADTLIDFIFSKVTEKKSVYVFAHNMAFDMMVTSLPMNFLNRGIEIQPYIRNQMVFIWSVKVNGGTIKFINTGNYTPFPLWKVAKDLGMTKLDIDFNTDDNNELIVYCRRDVEIIRELIVRFIQFLDVNHLGTFKLTLASQALYSYRKKFSDNLPYTHTDESILELEEKSYKGGRTECFHLGEFTDTNFYYTDINSMYPYVMRGNTMPKRMIRELTEISIDKVSNLMSERYLLCEVTLNTPLNFLGVLYSPDKYTITNTSQQPNGSKLLFPIGEFREILHHDELDYAMRKGFVKKIHKAVIYEKGDLFTDYIDFFTNMKIQASQDNNPTYRLIAKLFLNSLYGKFAQRHKWFEKISDHQSDLYGVDIAYNANTGRTHSEFKWFSETWGNFTDGWVEHSIPVIAGAVTAKARMLLWDYIYEIGINNMYYTDTDSLITNLTGYEFLQPFIHDTTLGKLKLEKESSEMSLYGCKDYRFGGERVLKGVPKSAIEIEKHTFVYDQFEGVAQWQRRDMTKPPTIFSTMKTKRTQYDKGILQNDGSIIPYEFRLVSP